jgi:hypothetical protein
VRWHPDPHTHAYTDTNRYPYTDPASYALPRRPNANTLHHQLPIAYVDAYANTNAHAHSDGSNPDAMRHQLPVAYADANTDHNSEPDN